MADTNDTFTTETIETTVAERIAALKSQEQSLFREAQEERTRLLAALVPLCQLLGPLTKKDVPSGIFRTRKVSTGEPKKKVEKKTESIKKAKAA